MPKPTDVVIKIRMKFGSGWQKAIKLAAMRAFLDALQVDMKLSHKQNSMTIEMEEK